MDYGELVDVYDALSETSSRLELTAILADALVATDEETLPQVVKLLRGKVFENWQSETLGMSSSLAHEAITKATGVGEETIEEWWRQEGDLGSAAERAVQEKTQQTLFSQSLTVQTAHDTLRSLSTFQGEGSQERRVNELAGLIADSEPTEAKYVVRTVLGAMRLGIGDGILRDAIAEAFLDGSDAAVAAVQRAYEVTNDFTVVAERARDSGIDGLQALEVEVFRPVKPMLAQSADSLEAALADLGDSEGEVLFETKYDGIRAKLHRKNGETRLFTRRLEDVTTQFPDVIEAVDQSISADTMILEAEIVGRTPDTGDPVPFQELSRRIKRKYGIEEMSQEIPATVHIFDLLYVNGESFLDASLSERLTAFEKIFTGDSDVCQRAEHRRTASVEHAESFYESSLGAGHEGLVAKNLDATYQPGSRVGYQQKIKPTMESLDLVVTRAKWSEGRKSDYLGRPYLACRDEADGSLKEVGRMHTGFTDAQLEDFTALVEPLIQEVNGREAALTPAVVLEVEFEEIQDSSKYDSGYALRFPRLLDIRTDLSVEDADTFARVQDLYETQFGG
jgi:DNA ligase-1